MRPTSFAMVPYNLNMSGQSLALVLIGKHANSKKTSRAV